jgi:hypothetical protein
MTDTCIDQPARTWRALSEAEWDAIREDYLCGFSAPELCERYEIGLSTLRQKARDGGWRRVDQPVDSEMFPADADRWVADAEDDGDDYEAAAGDDWAGLADMARLRLRRALASGRAADAGSWMRLYDRLVAQQAREQAAAQSAPEPEPEPEPDPVAAVRAMMRSVDSIARRAAQAAADGDDEALDALEAEVEAIKAEAAKGRPASDSSDALDGVFPAADAAASDASDSLDGVFPPDAPDPEAERARLTTLRERRISLGLGVSDIDATLAALSPGSRPRPGTPAHPAWSPGPARGSGAESGRSGR